MPKQYHLPEGVAVGAKGVVIHAIGQLRAAPSHRAEVVCQALWGWPIRLLESRGEGWVRVLLFEGMDFPYEGWLEWDAVLLVHPERWQQWMGESSVYILQKPLQLSLDRVLDKPEGLPGYLPAGAILYQEERNTTEGTLSTLGIHALPFKAIEVFAPPRIGLRKIHGPNLSQFLPDDGPVEMPTFNSLDNWLTLTTAWLGSPYLWGGNTTWGMDCSGFVFLYYWLQGRVLPRDAWQQAKMGWPAKYQFQLTTVSGLVPGDLLFFGEVKDKITHVAVYLEEDLYLHASGSLRLGRLVRRVTQDDFYRYQTLQQIRRIKPERLPLVGRLFAV